jgi:phosphate-selective porin OprO/OprP
MGFAAMGAASARETARMPRFVHLFSLCLALAATFAGDCPAQNASDDPRAAAPGSTGGSLHETLKAMQEEMAKLRQDNQAMKDQIDELRAKTDADWITEARATEIRSLVQDVLADSDSRASMLDDGVMAGWSEHFFLADAFGRFLLQVDGMMQFRYVYSLRDGFDSQDDNRDGFEVTRTRLTFRGHVYSEDLQYLVRIEATPHPPTGVAAGVFSVLDSWARYEFTNEWSVRIGQFKLPFMREELVSESERLAVEQSLMNLNLSVGRSQGVELAYHDSQNAWSIVASDGLSSRGSVLGGLMGGPRTNTSAIASNVEFALTSRFERLLAGSWEQFEDFTSPIDDEYGALLGAAIHWQINESTDTPIIGSGTEPQSVGFTIDYSVEWGGASAFVAATYHYIDFAPNDAISIGNLLGIVAQVSLYLAPKWEVFLRGEWAQFEATGGGVAQIPDMGIITGGFNYYIEGHDVKWTTDIGFSVTEIPPAGQQGGWANDLTGWRDVPQDGIPEVVFRSQIQILF